MATTKVRGHEFESFVIKDSFNRRAIQFRNEITETLKKVGVREHQIDIPLESFALKKAPASVSWYLDGRNLYYSYGSMSRFIENLYVVSQVIAKEVEAVLTQHKTLQEFTSEFAEDSDIEEQRKKAREVLGLSSDTKDLDVINKAYKSLAKEHHPDTPTGNLTKFKEINHAHKMLRRELE